MIFISNKEELVFQTFEVQPFRFIRKSELKELCPSLVDSIINELKRRSPQTFTIIENNGGDVLSFDARNIIYIEAQRKECKIVTTSGEATVKMKLMDLEEQLTSFHFAILIYMLHCIFPQKKAPWTTASYFVVTMGVFLILKYIPYVLPFWDYDRPYWYFYVISLPLALLFSHICLEGNFLSKTVYISFFTAFIQLAKMACSPIYRNESIIPAAEYQIIDIIFFIILVGLLILLASTFINWPLLIDKTNNHPRYYAVLYLPISLSVYYLLGVMNISFWDEYKDAILAFLIIPILPIFYDLFSTFMISNDEQRRLDKALTETKAQVFRYRYSLELEERIKKERHELKNNYLYIQTLLNEQKYDKLQAYLDETIGEKIKSISAISTGNSMIDYILNRKISKAI